MKLRPEKLVELVPIPLKAAQLILEPPAEMSEEQVLSRLQEELVLTKDQRQWIWEIHKNCDQLIHQRLASFTAAQAMTLASFGVLTVARFNAGEGIPPLRLELLDEARVWVIGFGLFLAFVSWFVIYPMFKRLKYLNDTYLFRDTIYSDYYHCIEWRRKKWKYKTKSKLLLFYRFYKSFIPLWLPIAEGLFWLGLGYLLWAALHDASMPSKNLFHNISG